MPSTRHPRVPFARSLVAAVVCALAPAAVAQGYPAKPIRVVVGFAAGGGTDVTSRLLSQRLSPLIGQSVVVENRTGASGAIAAEVVAKAPPDGYTLLMLASTTFIYSVLRAGLPYQLERDFAPITFVTSAPLMLVVHPSVPARTTKEFIALARARPGKLTYGSDGVGGTTHLAGELFKHMAQLDIVHVPFKGGSESALALASGHIDANLPSVPAGLPLLKAGKYRALAVTHARRSTLLPDVPTLHESGLTGFDLGTWFGLLAPVAVSKDIVAQLNAAVIKAVNTPEMHEAIQKQGMEPQTNTPEQFTAYMRALALQIEKIAATAKFKLE